MSGPNALQLSSLEIAENSLGILEKSERADALALILLCREVWCETGETPPLVKQARAIEGGRLVEFLARRSAKAMPYAALGRAFLAGLHGASKDEMQLLQEFQMKMSLLGL